MNLRERTRWAINHVSFEKRIRNEDIAKETDVNVSTVSNYRRMYTEPKAKFIKSFSEKYNINLKWLVSGEGEPFPGACGTYPEVCGNLIQDEIIDKKKAVNESGAAYDSGRQGDDDIKISEDLAMVARILESKTPYAMALHMNIRSFDAAVSAEQRLIQNQQRFEELERKISDSENSMGMWFNKKVAELDERISALQQENKILKGRLNDVGAHGQLEDPGDAEDGDNGNNGNTEKKAM